MYIPAESSRVHSPSARVVDAPSLPSSLCLMGPVLEAGPEEMSFEDDVEVEFPVHVGTQYLLRSCKFPSCGWEPLMPELRLGEATLRVCATREKDARRRAMKTTREKDYTPLILVISLS